MALDLLRIHVMRRWSPVALAVLLSGHPPPAEAIWVELTPDQVKEAVAHGTAAYAKLVAERLPPDNLDPEYVVDLGPDVGRAYLFTEFSSLSRETRRYLAIGMKIKDDDVSRVAEDSRGKIVVQVDLVGPKRDFLRFYKVRLVQRDQSHAPGQADVYRAAPVPGSTERHRGSALYTFTAKDVDPTAPVALVLSDGTDREIRFEFDLPRLR